MSPALESYFSEYATFHATPGNKACHMFAIPLIVLSVFAMLAHVRLGQLAGVSVTAAEATLLAATLYYLTLDAVLALLMLAASVVLIAAGRQIPLLPAVALFVFGWIIQFVGHYAYEKKSPAFFRNLTHLLVGPLWVLAKATGRA
jgi:uncharacterized membrane protein YGL010W